MRDRAYSFLKTAAKPLPADTILAEIMQVHSPAHASAEKIMAALIGKDPRFDHANGLWYIRDAPPIRTWDTDSAFLYIEAAHRTKHCRGAIHCTSGHCFEFDSSTSAAAIVEALDRTKGKVLFAWGKRDLHQLNQLLAKSRIPEWTGEFLSLGLMASRLFHRKIQSPNALASVLDIHVPEDSDPKEMARFISDCVPLLLDRIPAEYREEIGLLQTWVNGAEKTIDFGHFEFDLIFLKQLPESPGVYIMKDRTDRVLYVGQSGNLRKRVRSYFVSSALEQPKIQKIHESLYRIEVRQTKNEVEALLLEMRLIRRLKPVINLQTEVHRDIPRHGPRNIILMASKTDYEAATLYFLRENCFIGKQLNRLGTSAAAKLRERIRRIFFGKSKEPRRHDPREMEIVARWMARHGKRLNWLDVDEAGSFGNVIRLLNDYLHDPDNLSKKVYYR